jgi:hypothetical protein
MPSRSGHQWSPLFSFWKGEGGYWHCERKDLEAAIAASGVDEEHMRRVMGFGFFLLGRALDGMRLTKYEVSHVEAGITPNQGYRPTMSSPGMPAGLEPK